MSLVDVKTFWERSSCGEVYATGADKKAQYAHQACMRYQLEPYLLPFADFELARGKDALEIGVGMGADHQQLAQVSPRRLCGVDLTERAVAMTRERLTLFDLTSHLQVGNAESLAFEEASFDYVYSWGVIHHSPNTAQAVSEIYRVLRPGGRAKIMIYHKYSMVGFLLWFRYALLCGRPWLSLSYIYSTQLESPGTKAYSVKEAQQLFASFGSISIRPLLSFGDLLEGAVGQRHRGLLLTCLKEGTRGRSSDGSPADTLWGCIS